MISLHLTSCMIQYIMREKGDNKTVIFLTDKTGRGVR